MTREAELTVRFLQQLRKRYGDFNRALVVEYVKANGSSSISAIAQDLGVNRSVVRRALQDPSERDT
jgi:predicted ArsR family transcriptional regulator